MSQQVNIDAHGGGADHGPHEVTFNIYVNGEPDVWHDRKITYEQLVDLAFPNGPKGGDVRYSVSWTAADGRQDSLRPGKHVNVEDGMQFDVRNTDKS